MDYKETLLMPKTEFQMKGNLPENEAIQRAKWEEMDLYNKVREKNKGRKPFVLHDGPPYANGSIHIGHAMNKILKDFVNRYAMMSGRDMIYIPGWDTHGLPIEQAVTNSGVDRKSLSKAEFRNICEEYAKKQIATQMEGFKKLNVLADWDNYYATFQHELEAKQIEVFATMAKKGLIFKGMKPVYWSPSSESALAEAEIEYKDRTDASIFVAFPVEEGNEYVQKGDNLVIWTTTPWTLPGNTAIAVGADFDYVKVEVDGKNYVVASMLLDSLKNDFKWENVKVLETFLGSKLEGVKYHHVFMDRISPVVLGDEVTLDAGTGLVHTAPSYGDADFILGKKYNLEMVFGIDDDGKLNKESGEFAGLYFEDANKAVITKLNELGVLLCVKSITHSYPHDWRTKKPVVFRATAQWFCSIAPIKDEILNEIENNIKWHPEWGKVRLHNMIEGRGDWCISRQRVWGVPLPIFYNEDGSPILDYDVMMHVADLFREHGSNYWFEKDAKDLLPEGYTNPASPNGKFTKEQDIMDVWFDSGTTHTGVLCARGLDYPADVYLEGSDQYRGWFNSSLICGVAMHGQSPYKECISHGFTLDAKGNKMSKSLGNGIDPLEEIKKRGADVLRLWVSSTDYTEDVRIGDEILKQVQESYRKIRNTYKFMLGNLNNFDPSKDAVKYEDMLPYDKYMMNELSNYVKDIKSYYEKYEYQNVYKTTNNFITFKLSNFYLDFTKDILYIEKEDSLVRRSVQTVLYNILKDLVVLLAPILPYTSEEVYRFIPGEKLESVHLNDMPEAPTYEFDSKLWELFFDVKDDVFKALEEARNEKVIGSSLEAEVKLNLGEKYKPVREQLEKYLHQLLIVSKVEFTDDETLPKASTIRVEVLKSNGQKCNRCWNYVDELDGDICHRCSEILKETK
ncbi:isoleucine--tRNA ligase [bacterium]|nr:isoleucine--tRNA ligase [bacterium]MDY3757036.1 isoleucine--tRNA ligase [Bacilli bacterium]